MANMWKGKVAVFSKPGVPIEIREEESPNPASNELLVRMEMAGVCGSDAHRLKGDQVALPKPVCFGHEGVGVIEVLGDDITHDSTGSPIKVGDRLYWLPSTPCRKCDACDAKNPLLCKHLNWPVAAGGPNAAAFRELATLKDRCIMIRIPEGTTSESVITFGCAMPTAVTGFKKLGKDLGQNIVIQGSGPVGLASTLLASLSGAKNVIVIGDPERRLDAAKQLGATEVISVSKTTVEERKKRIQEITNDRGATAVVEAAGHPAAFPEGFELLGMGGKYLIMGLYSGNAITPIDPVRINNLNLQIIGSLGIEIESYARTVEIATEHGSRLRFSDLITHRYPLQDLEKAIGSVAKLESVKMIVVPQKSGL